MVEDSQPTLPAKLGMQVVDLPLLSQAVSENLVGRTGGAVSLAVGMAEIFRRIPFMDTMVAYWYHFAIMFEAVFILTAIDAGTRVGRFFLQEMIGSFAPRFDDKRWWPGVVITSFLFTGTWGYLLYTGDISTIWPLFGMSNQLLASVGLIIGTVMIIRLGKAKYAWTTAVPGVALTCITMWAGYLSVTTNFLPKQLYLLATLAIVVMVLMTIVIVGAFRRCMKLLKVQKTVQDQYGEPVLEVVPE